MSAGIVCNPAIKISEGSGTNYFYLAQGIRQGDTVGRATRVHWSTIGLPEDTQDGLRIAKLHGHAIVNDQLHSIQSDGMPKIFRRDAARGTEEKRQAALKAFVAPDVLYTWKHEGVCCFLLWDDLGSSGRQRLEWIDD